ncbi:biotin/lipoyl-binding protein [Devosia sp. A8/3-2]|nr:biotin/lipoyl-binding protein [Devosia sp. A8/3-2]
MKAVTKIVLALVVIGGAGAAGWWLFAAPKAATVPNTVTVSRADIEQTVPASGVLQANSLVSVGAEVSGRIDAVNVKLGQDVKKGDVIAEIDSLNQENAVKAAQAALTAIRAQKRAQEATLVQAQRRWRAIPR